MDKFTAKLGPLPVWAWGAIIGLLLLAFVWFSRSGGSTAATDTASGTTDAEASPLFPSSSNTVPSDTDTTAGSTDTTTSTNSYWLTQGSAFAVSRGYSPTAAIAALTKWLNGDTITADEQRIVDAVVKQIGAPPEGTSGTSTVTPAPTTAKPSTINWHTVTRITASPSTVTRGKPFSVSGTVAWVTATGHTYGPPAGRVDIYHANGSKIGTGAVRSGTFTATATMPTRAPKGLSGVTAHFVGSGGALASASSDRATTIK